MPGMFGNNPPLMLIAIGIVIVAAVVFALMTAGYQADQGINGLLIGSYLEARRSCCFDVRLGIHYYPVCGVSSVCP